MMWYSSHMMLIVCNIYFEYLKNFAIVVNVEKTKMMVVQTIQPHHYPMLTYRRNHIQFVRSFKYLVIDVPATNK